MQPNCGGGVPMIFLLRLELKVFMKGKEGKALHAALVLVLLFPSAYYHLR